MPSPESLSPMMNQLGLLKENLNPKNSFSVQSTLIEDITECPSYHYSISFNCYYRDWFFSHNEDSKRVGCSFHYFVTFLLAFTHCKKKAKPETQELDGNKRNEGDNLKQSYWAHKISQSLVTSASSECKSSFQKYSSWSHLTVWMFSRKITTALCPYTQINFHNTQTSCDSLKSTAIETQPHTLL